MTGDYFTFDPDEEREQKPTKDTRCTPDKLLAFAQQLGRCPTLAECKAEFGGIIGPWLDAAALQAQGRWPKWEGRKVP